jgi:hypothetical protein
MRVFLASSQDIDRRALTNSSVRLMADLELAPCRPVPLGEYPSPPAKRADRPRFAPAAILRAASPGVASCAESRAPRARLRPSASVRVLVAGAPAPDEPRACAWDRGPRSLVARGGSPPGRSGSRGRSTAQGAGTTRKEKRPSAARPCTNRRPGSSGRRQPDSPATEPRDRSCAAAVGRVRWPGGAEAAGPEGPRSPWSVRCSRAGVRAASPKRSR